MTEAGRIRVGIGGWTFAPWRDNFYPAKLPQARELSYASQHVTTIEINGTFYRSQSPASFRKWRDETPDDFVFSVKGHRGVVNQSRLAEAGESIGWFLDSGVLELGSKLGPLLWQMPPYRRFDREEIAAFFAQLPRERGGLPLRHAFEPRHETFKDPAFVDLAREASVAIVYADAAKYPSIADPTADFVYARLQNASAEIDTGYPADALDAWAGRCRNWADGAVPGDLALIGTAPTTAPRPVFLYMINGAKEHAPAAAMSLLDRIAL